MFVQMVIEKPKMAHNGRFQGFCAVALCAPIFCDRMKCNGQRLIY